IVAFLDDLVRQQRVAGDDLERRAQRRVVGPRSFETGEVDLAEAVLRPRNDVEPNRRAAAAGRFVLARLDRADRAEDLRVVVTVDPQQAIEQVLVGTRLCGKPRGVVVVIEILDRRQRFEPVEELIVLREQRAFARERQHQLVGNSFFGAHLDARQFEIEVGELYVGFGLKRLDRRQLDLVRPRDVDQCLVERRIWLEIPGGLRGSGVFRRNPLPGPGLRVGYGGVGYQLAEFAIGDILGRKRRCNERQRGRECRQRTEHARERRIRRRYTASG